MSPVDTVANRVRTALMGGVIGIFVTALGSVLNAIGTPDDASTGTEVTFTIFISLVRSFPGLLAFAGIIIAMYTAGPPGLIGAVIEVIEVNRLFDSASSGGIELVCIGAIVVVVSSIFPRPQIYREILSDNGY